MKLKTIFLILMGCLLFTGVVYSQDNSESEKPKKDRRPVRSPFESTWLLDKQTTKTNMAKTFQMVIQHRFGNINSEGFDLIGIYGATNIRIGLNYSILDQLQVGIGTSKNKLIQDLNWKWAIMQQTQSNSRPVAITYYGNVAMESLEKENYAKFSHRLSYFHEIMVSRKFNKMFTLQIHFNYAHFNVVDSSSYVPEGETVAVKHDREHDNFGVGLIGRAKITPQTSILFEYDQPITRPEIDESHPNISLGVEISTGSHAFQIMVGSYKAIIPQRNLVYNENDFMDGDIFIGFNITRLWNF